jgi:hypothetical protein
VSTADIITPKETIKGKATGYSSQIRATSNSGRVTQLSVITDSAVYSSTTNKPHEYFDLTGFIEEDA